jgi:hypothetical protein
MLVEPEENPIHVFILSFVMVVAGLNLALSWHG